MVKVIAPKYLIDYSITHGIFELDEHHHSRSKLTEIIECASDFAALQIASQRAFELARSYAPSPKTGTVKVHITSIKKDGRKIGSSITVKYDPKKDPHLPS